MNNYTKKTYPVTDAKNLVRDKSLVRTETTDVIMERKALGLLGETDKPVVDVKVQPLGDRLIVRKVAEVQTGLIILPGVKRENSEKGVVLAVGPGRFGEHMNTKVGDEILFTKHGVMDIEIEGEAFVMMRESDILAIL